MQQRGFATARRPDKSNNFAGSDCSSEVLNDVEVAKRLCHFVECQFHIAHRYIHIFYKCIKIMYFITKIKVRKGFCGFFIWMVLKRVAQLMGKSRVESCEGGVMMPAGQRPTGRYLRASLSEPK